MDDKQKYMRWLETMWDLHNRISREEKRKAEVLEVFEGLARLSRRRVEARITRLGSPPEESENIFLRTRRWKQPPELVGSPPLSWCKRLFESERGSRCILGTFKHFLLRFISLSWTGFISLLLRSFLSCSKSLTCP
jgi:hypothetical protein